jgi:membrane associated rhomboid family serine protease
MINQLNRLEKKYKRFAIPNLMIFIILGQACVFLVASVDPSSQIIYLLGLQSGLVLQGELWRLLTFIFIPPSLSFIWVFFALYFYYLVGTGLEQEWGTFKFNVFYLTGMILNILASFITQSFVTATYMNLALFLAFAQIYPNFEVRLFLILPIKVKYLAWLNWAFLVFTLLTGSLGNKILALVPIANFFLYFGNDFFKDLKRRRQVQMNRKRFFSETRKSD